MELATLEDVTYDDDGDGTATITINRPDRLNALRRRTFEDLATALEHAGADPSIGVVVLAGAGRAFCAGGDLGMASEDLTTAAAVRHHFVDRMLRISNAMLYMDKVVLCSVHGPCVGAGFEIACFADIVLAADSARFRVNGTDLGACSWWGAPQLLALMVGLRRAEDLLYTSRWMDGGEAARIGFANATVPDAQLSAEVTRWCESILTVSADGVRMTKAALRAIKEQPLSTMTAQMELNVEAAAGPRVQGSFGGFLTGTHRDWRAERRTTFR
jgi:enoyl-CoA hydratase/carnithine racemase